MSSKLYLIPNTLGGEKIESVLPPEVSEVVSPLRVFFIEEIRSARRLLKKMDKDFPINECEFYDIGKNSKEDFFALLFKLNKNKQSIGVISEAGCPGIADPGAELVSICHQLNIPVVPLVGASSVFLALMASGFSGQNFCFHGYLPKDRKLRIRKIKQMEMDTRKNSTTNIFMDAPYRNMHVYEDLLAETNNLTLLSISCNLTLPNSFIKTQSIEMWKKEKNISLNKKPALFLFGSFN